MTPALAAFVGIGIVLVTVLTWALGWSKRAELDPGLARQRFLEDFPEARIDDLIVATDRASALLWLGGVGGVVYVVGDRFATRKLDRAVVRADGDALIVDFGEYGNPPVRVGVTDAVWRERLHA
ncbi:MAG: hypothetical protein R3F61_08975 [Myxococcota bacterium]